jgi:hypothetical protein
LHQGFIAEKIDAKRHLEIHRRTALEGVLIEPAPEEYVEILAPRLLLENAEEQVALFVRYAGEIFAN